MCTKNNFYGCDIMKENKNINLSADQISFLRDNLQKLDVQNQIKNIDDYKIIKSLCKDLDKNGSGLTASNTI